MELVITTVAPDVRIPLLTIMIQQRPLTMAVVRFLDAPFLKLAILTQKPLSMTVLASLNLASMQAALMQMPATTTQRLCCLTFVRFPGFPCDDGDDMTINDVVGEDCNCAGEAVVNGCTDSSACNYDASANVTTDLC